MNHDANELEMSLYVLILAVPLWAWNWCGAFRLCCILR